jgi:ubiquinone/menaquinone biosynthesis C-methylase UbiE
MNSRLPCRQRRKRGMGFYSDLVLPRLLDHAMRNEELVGYRRRIAGAAHGRVLEVGIGSGLNLPFYGPGVTEIIGLDPSGPLFGMASQRAEAHDRAVSFLTASAEAIPLDAGSVDTVVTTWTMCSIPDAGAALAEMRRVLRPGGDLLFVEHGRAPDPWVVRVQDLLTPVWRPLAGGCHLNRPMVDLITGAGFRMQDLRTGYAPGPKPFTFLYEGRAKGA